MDPQVSEARQEAAAESREQVSAVDHPAKLLRIASMVRELLEEVRQSPLDEGGRARLRDVHDRTVKELEEVLTEDLQQELRELAPPLDESPSESELRVAQAQLLGWLEGLFHGIQAALWSQHMQAQAALQEMRRRGIPATTPHDPRERSPEQAGPPGQYL